MEGNSFPLALLLAFCHCNAMARHSLTPELAALNLLAWKPCVERAGAATIADLAALEEGALKGQGIPLGPRKKLLALREAAKKGKLLGTAGNRHGKGRAKHQSKATGQQNQQQLRLERVQKGGNQLGVACERLLLTPKEAREREREKLELFARDRSSEKGEKKEEGEGEEQWTTDPGEGERTLWSMASGRYFFSDCLASIRLAQLASLLEEEVS